MQTHHYVMLIVAVIVGYVIARFFPAPGQMVGLP